MMKACIYKRYGSPKELTYSSVDKPSPKEDEVLIKIRASSINSWDYDQLTGKPFLYRIMFGIFKPRNSILGIDVAGTVEAVGKNVNQLKIGDEVFGDISADGFGGFAEYTCAREKSLAIKPKEMSFEEAASIPHTAVLALQSIRMKQDLKPGDKVLINGAGGGVGTFGIQLLKETGVEITGVDHHDKLNTLKELGYHKVIDYNEMDFTSNGIEYDLILDPVATRAFSDYERALAPNGMFIMIGGNIRLMFHILLKRNGTLKKIGKSITMLPHEPNNNDLDFLSNLYAEKRIKPIIDRLFQLKELSKAMAYYQSGKTKGKIVITH